MLVTIKTWQWVYGCSLYYSLHCPGYWKFYVIKILKKINHDLKDIFIKQVFIVSF